MVLCTAQQNDWTTDPLSHVNFCASMVSDVPEDGPSLSLCAGPASKLGNGYLDEVIAVTDNLYPQLTPG